MTRFDWPALMRAAAGAGLAPAAFWALTPAEFLLWTGLDRAASPMDRARLSELAARFPDLS